MYIHANNIISIQDSIICSSRNQNIQFALISCSQGFRYSCVAASYPYFIQDVGRFCERFASDFIISWDMVRKQLEPRPVTEPYYTVEIFGIRRAGVDHNNFFLSHLRNDSRGRYFCCENVYRKVLALGIEILPAEPPGREPRVACTLKDLTDELWRVEPGDLEENAA